ncbi:MAG TPA: sugar ABC transporter permease [Clostridiaceae bacterium]|nr:sugar ABC transporter permease [Clostridiaceae bacterium]
MIKRYGLRRSDSRLAIILLAPAFIYLALLLFFPLLWGIVFSFSNKVIGAEAVFTGLSNFKNLITNINFLNSVKATCLYTVFAIFFKTLFGIIMALLLNMEFRGRSFVRALLLIPWTLPNLVAVLNWKWIFANQGGALNGLLSALGLIDENIIWLATAGSAFICIIIVNVWRGVPFFGITILSKLQTIPLELYEAASIDGASRIQKFFNITMPSIRDITLLSALVSTIWTINDFESIWLLTGGGPNGKTAVITVFSYTTAIQSMQIGKALAVSVLAMPILILLITQVTRLSTRSNTQ